MEIQVLASSSRGNAYVVKGETHSLLLEAGLPIKELKRLLNYTLPQNCLITHSHKDHSKSAKELHQRFGVDVRCSKGTSTEIGFDITNHNIFAEKKDGSYYQVTIGEFLIIPFKVEHDCTEPDPLGYLIYHKPSQKKILFVTDTMYVKFKFARVNIVMIECNYAKDILDNNKSINNALRNRILASHFELERVKQFFMVSDLSKLEQVVLLHLSNDNSDEARFQREIQEVVKVPVHIATPGLKIQI